MWGMAGKVFLEPHGVASRRSHRERCEARQNCRTTRKECACKKISAYADLTRLHLLALMALAAMAFSGCAQFGITKVTVQERLLVRPNPTNYVFEAGVSDV